jgi:hypothetical protein
VRDLAVLNDARQSQWLHSAQRPAFERLISFFYGTRASGSELSDSPTLSLSTLEPMRAAIRLDVSSGPSQPRSFRRPHHYERQA